MVSKHPELQRPEGKLLEIALKRDPRSARKVADALGLSDTRVRHIINGYQPAGRGQLIEVDGPAPTVARLAIELGVSAEDMERSGRTDVAELMADSAAAGNTDELEYHKDYEELFAWFEAWRQGGPVDPPDLIFSVIRDERLIAELASRLHSRAEGFKNFRDQAAALRTRLRGVSGEWPAPTAVVSAPDDSLELGSAAHREETSIGKEAEELEDQ